MIVMMKYQMMDLMNYLGTRLYIAQNIGTIDTAKNRMTVTPIVSISTVIDGGVMYNFELIRICWIFI